jgi:hypothetical protein
MTILFGIAIVGLSCWGTGLCFPLAGLYLLSVLFLGIWDSTVELLLCACGLMVAPLMARFVAHILKPLFIKEAPSSLVTMLVALFLLAMISDKQVVSLFSLIARGNTTINLASVSGLIAESLYISALIGATLILVIALLEIPFHWFFAPKNPRSIDWLSAIRPLLLIIVVMGCVTEISELLIESLNRGVGILYSGDIS